MLIKYKDGFALGVLSLAVLLVRIVYITRVYGPIVYTDEMGYWGHAANLTGNTWAGVMNEMPWYSFGYSLLLVPIFYISHSMVVMYRAAVVLNAIFGIISFWVAYKLICKTTDLTCAMAGCFAFVSVSYSEYIFHSYVAWSETLIALLVWLILYETITFEQRPSWWKGLLLGIAAGYGYMVHNRMLAVMGAIILVSLVLLFVGKIRLGHFLNIIAGMLVMTGGYVVMENNFRELMNDSAVLEAIGIEVTSGNANTFAAQLGKMLQIFTLEGMKNFCWNTIGQIWQFLSATYLMAGLGVLYCISNIRKVLRTRDGMAIYILPVAMLVLTTAMTSLFFVEDSSGSTVGTVRLDTLFYGRYNAVLMGPLIMLCLVSLVNIKNINKKYILWSVGVYLAFTCMMQYHVKDIQSFYLNIVAAVGIHTFHWLGEFAVWKCAVMTVGVGLILWLFCGGVSSGKPKTDFESEGKTLRILYPYMISVLLMILFTTTALKCMQLSIRGENDFTLQYEEIYSYLRDHTQKNELIYTSENGKFAYDIQTRVVDRPVISVPVAEYGLIGDEAYVVVSETGYKKLNTAEWDVCLEKNGYYIITKKTDN